MRYSASKTRFIADRYRNTTQAMTPRVIVQPSIETARSHLASLRCNLQIGINTAIYAAQIEKIYDAFPELKGELCKPQSEHIATLTA